MKKDTKTLLIFILVCIVIILAIVIPNIIEKNKIQKTFETMGEGASEFIEGINNAKSHLDEFTYNNETGEVEYHPKNK